jgi:cold shock CspA family protein
MARPQETFNKKELEKRRLQKRKEKEQRKEQRKAESKDGKTLEDMLAYVDENGNITDTPPDPTKKKTVIKEGDIEIGARNAGNSVQAAGQGLRTGKVTFFNHSKGFGFIKDMASGESVFVHMNALETNIKENDKVSFEIGKGAKGSVALHVKTI